MFRSTFWAPRCSAPNWLPPWGFPTPSPHTLPHRCWNRPAQTYRENFNAAGSLLGPDAKPHFIAAANVVVHDDAKVALRQVRKAQNGWIRQMLGRGTTLSDDDVEQLRDHPAGQQVLGMLSRTASGAPEEVTAWLESFADQVDADELMLVNLAPDEEVQHRALELLAPQPAS